MEIEFEWKSEVKISGGALNELFRLISHLGRELRLFKNFR